MRRREFLPLLGGVFGSVYFNCFDYKSFASESGESRESKIKLKSVYLTIDDGPSSNMKRILDFLDKYTNNKVTFFVVGENLRYEENMRLAVEAVEKGHVIGSHTHSHPDFNEISLSKAIREIKKGGQYVDWVYDGANRKNPKLFRFPFGNKGNRKNRRAIQDYLIENEYTQFYWDVDTLDWQYYNGKRSLESVIGSVKNTSERNIVLAHDFNKKGKVCTTIEIMKYFIERGVQLRSLRPKLFPHTYLELPNPEESNESAEKSINLVTVVESP